MLWTIWGLVLTQYQNSWWLDMYTGLRCWMHLICVNAILCVTFSRFSCVDHWDGWKYLCTSAWTWLSYVHNVLFLCTFHCTSCSEWWFTARRDPFSYMYCEKWRHIDPGFVLKVIRLDILQRQQWHYHFKTHSQSAYWSILQGNTSCLQLLHTVHFTGSLCAVSCNTGVIITWTHPCLNVSPTRNYYWFSLLLIAPMCTWHSWLRCASVIRSCNSDKAICCSSIKHNNLTEL
jgi:hypothetical protein